MNMALSAYRRLFCKLVVELILIAWTQGVLAANAIPGVSISAPATVSLGSGFSLSITFDNTSTNQAGYGPYIDLAYDATGADGVTPGTNTATQYDGISIPASGAVTYLGLPVIYQILTFDDAANGGLGIPHPYAVNTAGIPLYIKSTDYGASFTNGDKLVVAQLPFGSFTPLQPVATLVINANVSNLADVGGGLPMAARGGFQFGNDPLANPSVDPSIVGGLISVTPNVTPSLLSLAKIYLGPENETATGPDYPRQYRLDLTVAPGQILSNVVIRDVLPAQMQFLSLNSVSGGTVVTQSLPGTTIPGGTLSVTLGSVTGGVNASVLFTFFVPRLDATSNAVLNATTGVARLLDNQAYAFGDWKPIDTRDAVTQVVANATLPGPTPDAAPEHTLEAQSIAIQKSAAIVTDTGASGYSPGDVVEYTLSFQVSDYYAFQGITVVDRFSDGQRVDTNFTPRLTVTEHGATLASAAFVSTNWSELALTDGIPNNSTPALEGGRQLTFRVSDEMGARGADGILLGGGVTSPWTNAFNNPPLPFGGTVGTITFRVVLQDKFSESYPSGESTVDPRDSFSNSAVITGAVLNVTNLVATGSSVTDDTSAGFSITYGTLTKSIYAVNGNRSFTSPLNVLPGDLLTYRLLYSIPSGDVEALKLLDYLPLPVFKAGDADANGTAGPAWIFDDVISTNVPAAGHAKFGTNETFRSIRGVAPTVSMDTNSGNNTLIFDYGTYSNVTNDGPYFVDILFTVTVSTDPFADALFLSNQAESSEQNTASSVASQAAIIQIVLNEPNVSLFKGVVGYGTNGLTLGGIVFTPPTNSASSFSGGPVFSASQVAAIGASDLFGNLVDSGDTVRYAIALQNIGRSDAFDVQLTDAVPVSFRTPANLAAMNLTVRHGDGTLLVSGTGYTANLSGTNLGLRLTDNYSAGNVAPESSTGSVSRGYNAGTDAMISNGSSVVIITYDLVVGTNAQALGISTNTAALTNFASVVGGPNFIPEGLRDTAVVNFRPATFSKTLLGTEISNAFNNVTNAVIGEWVTYRATVTLPEGTTRSAVMNDTLDAGLAFMDVTNVTSSAGVTMGTPIGTGTNPANVTVTGNGRLLTFSFGNIVNTDTNNLVPETIDITYRAVVLNALTNQSGSLLGNTASFTYTNNPTPLSGAAAKIQVIEPIVSVSKSVSTNAAGPYAASVTNADAGDTIFYLLRLTNAAGGSAPAYNVLLRDVMPGGLSNVAIFSVTGNTAYVTNDFVVSGGTISTVLVNVAMQPTGLTLFPSNWVDVVVSAKLVDLATPGQLIRNTNVLASWTSLDDGFMTGTTSTPRSVWITNSVERTGTDGPGAGLNNYATQTVGNVDVTILNPTPVKTLVATSEALTPGNNVTVGEIIRYRIAWQMPEGIVSNLFIRDNLPPGLLVLSDTNATLAFIANGAGLASSVPAISGIPGLAISSNSPVTPNASALIPASAIREETAGSGFLSGEDVFFDLGSVTNLDRDPDAEYIVIEFNALVHNLTNDLNRSGLTRTNTAVIGSGAANFSPVSGNVIVTNVEPRVSIAKNVSAGPYDAGDTVTYTLLFTNAATRTNSTAFDISVSDTLSAFLTNAVLVSSNTSTGVTGLFASVAGNLLTAGASVMTTGATFSLTYTAQLSSNMAAGQLVTNNAAVTYTSLPGSNGTVVNPTGSVTPGAPGSSTGERTGSGTAPNTYLGTASRSISIALPVLDKMFKNGSISDDDSNVAGSTGTNVVIGEQVTYDILTTLPEGVTRGLRIQDTVPVGLRLDAYQVLTVAGASSLLTQSFGGTVTATPTVTLPATGATNVLFVFGDTTVTEDNNPTNNAFVLRLAATVLNVMTNQDGTSLKNTASVLYVDPAGPTNTIADAVGANDPVVVVRESTLTITKTDSPQTGDAADPVTYTMTIANNSGQTAYEATLRDVLPPELSSPAILSGGGNFSASNFYNVAVSAATTNMIGSGFNSGVITGVVLTGPNLVIDGVTLITNDLVLVKDQSPALQNGIYVVSNIAATATFARWSAFDQTNEITVGYLAQVSAGIANSNGVYRQTASLTNVNVDPIVWAGFGTFRAPQVSDFQIVSAGGSNVLSSVSGVNLDIPPGASVVLKVQGTISSLVTPNLSVTNRAAVLWSSVDGVNPDERNGSDLPNPLLSTPDAAVLNNYAVSGLATFDVNGFQAGKTLFSTDQAFTSGTNVTIGEKVTYALKVNLPEGATSSLVVTDSLPAGLSYDSYSIVSNQSLSGGLLSLDLAGSVPVPTVTTNGSIVAFSFGAIAVSGDNVTTNNAFLILVTARVVDAVGNVGFTPPGQTSLTNAASFDVPGDGVPATNSGPVTVLVVEPRMNLVKDIVQTNADASDVLTISLTVTNSGTSPAFDVVVADTLNPAKFITSLISLGTPGVAYPADFTATTNPATGMVQYSGGTVTNGTSVRFTFTVPLAAGVIPGEVINNTGTVTHATTLPGTVTGERDEPSVSSNDTVAINSSGISGYVYHDANNDGVRGGGEIVLTNVTITLTGTNHLGNAVALTTNTAADGSYTFLGLRPGSYTITETQPAGYLDGKETVGTLYGGTVVNTVDSQVISSVVIPLGSQATGVNYNFGELLPASLAGKTFVDASNDGLFNGPDTGLSNVTVTLTGTDDRGAPVTTVLATDASGNYLFSGLRPGTYVITETQPVTYADGIDKVGSLSGTNSANDVFTAIPVASAQNGTGYNFAELGAHLGDFTWVDSNQNGVQDGGEPGLSNIVVRLYDTNSVVVGITTSSVAGVYGFPGLAPGIYTVQFVTPSGWALSLQDAGGDDALDSDASMTTGLTAPIVLLSGQTNLTADAGFFLPSPNIALVKTAGNAADGGIFYTTSNSVVVYTYAVSNAGNTYLSSIVVTDNVLGVVGTVSNLAPFSATNLLFSTAVLADVTNIAIVAGSPAFYNAVLIPNLTRLAATNDAIVDVVRPAIGIVKLANSVVEGGTNFILAGQSVTYTYAVTNSGDLTLTNVVVTDNKLGVIGTLSVFPTGSATNLSYTTNIFADVVNVATVVGWPNVPGVGPVTNTNDAVVDVVSLVIGDRVWLDENSDGVQDAGEAGIPNVRVILLTTNGVALATNVTGVNGSYLFTGLLPGAFVVRVDTNSMPAGLVVNQTFDPDSVTNHQTTVILTGNSAPFMAADFGYNWAATSDVKGSTGTGAIGDRLWIDANGNGLQDPGEPGLGGVTVSLVNLGPDGIPGTADDVTNTTTTAVDGNYIFDGLMAGAYVVTVNGGTPPAGYTATGDGDGIFDNRTTTPILLAPGDVYLNADFGYQPAASSTIGDLIYFDVNADGTNNAGDFGLAGVTVSLLNSNGVVIATTVTATNGLYMFPGLPAGTYTVWVSDTAGLLARLSISGDPDGVGGLDGRSTLTVNGTSSYLDRDFGYTVPGQTPAAALVGDTVYLDRNANGTADPGEGLQGVTVRLTDTNGLVLTTTVTDGTGKYYFGQLAAGTYVVVIATNTLPGVPGQLTNTADPDAGTASQSKVTLTAGQINLVQDFGYRDLTVPNTLAGTIWNDANANGFLNAGESNRFAGVTLSLLDTNGNGVATTVTDANGDYLFSGLPDGTYLVDVTDAGNLLNGYWHSTGPAPGVDSNSQYDAYTVTVSGGQTNTTADFGYYIIGAALGNRVWFDADHNGVQNPGETNLVNIRVVLQVVYTNGVTNVVTMLTDTNGYYGFGNLLLDENYDGVAPGGPVYTLSVIMPGNKVGQTILGATNSFLDSDNVLGTVATAVKGITNVGALANPGNEPSAASYDFGLYWQPTLARLTGFRAFSRDAQVVVSWETAEELNTAGFYLERLVNEGYRPVNADLIPSFEMGGGIYEQVDPAAQRGGTYTYRLIELETSGNRLYLGPYVVTVDGEALSFDEWSRAMFETKDLFNVQVSGENADPDGDGMSNLDEFRAGTRPMDRNSSLRIRSFERLSGDGFSVRWLSESNRYYTIERSTNLLEGFTPLTNGILATPHENQHFDAIQSAPGSVFYRVRME